MVGIEEAKDQTTTEYYYDSAGNRHPYDSTTSGDYSTLASALSGINGAAVSIMMGDWTVLMECCNQAIPNPTFCHRQALL